MTDLERFPAALRIPLGGSPLGHDASPFWPKIASKIDLNFEERLKKNRFSLGKPMILKVQGIELGGKNR